MFFKDISDILLVKNLAKKLFKELKLVLGRIILYRFLNVQIMDIKEFFSVVLTYIYKLF